MTIDRILIGCNKKDWHLAKICLASIRYWCPNVPIELIVDELNGKINTSGIERQYNATRYNTEYKQLGWGLGTLLPIISNTSNRSLYLDADIVFLGDVVSHLQNYSQDILVSVDTPENMFELMELSYFTQEKIMQFDPSFTLPTFLFNSGHLVFSDGILAKSDFERMVDWTNAPPTPLKKDTFICADQSMLNYHFTRLANLNKISVKQLEFAIWGFNVEAMNKVSLADIAAKKGIPKMIHWAGIKPHRLSKMPRADVLAFYENMHYQGVAFGKIRKQFLHLQLYYRSAVLKLKKRIIAFKNSI